MSEVPLQSFVHAPTRPESMYPLSGVGWGVFKDTLATQGICLQGLLESKDTHRPQEGPMLLGIDLP